MLKDKKSIIAMILDARKKDPVMEDQGNPIEDSSIGLESAAEDIMAAVEKKDAKSLVEALCNFIEMYDKPEEESESEPKPMESEAE